MLVLPQAWTLSTAGVTWLQGGFVDRYDLALSPDVSLRLLLAWTGISIFTLLKIL